MFQAPHLWSCQNFFHTTIIYLALLQVINYFILLQWKNTVGELILAGKEEPNHSQSPRPSYISTVLTEYISDWNTGRLTYKSFCKKSKITCLVIWEEFHGGNRFSQITNLRFIKYFFSRKPLYALLVGVFQQRKSKSSLLGKEKKEQSYFKTQPAEIFHKGSATFKC